MRHTQWVIEAESQSKAAIEFAGKHIFFSSVMPVIVLRANDGVMFRIVVEVALRTITEEPYGEVTEKVYAAYEANENWGKL